MKSTTDGQAWSRFVELHTPLLFFWARKSGLQAADAADLTQDVLTIVHREMGQLAHYRIQRLLGAGSTGVVYQAIDEQLQRNVALKILRPSLGEPARRRFIAEARATAAIDHPHVITIYQVGVDGELAYIAMQRLFEHSRCFCATT